MRSARRNKKIDKPKTLKKLLLLAVVFVPILLSIYFFILIRPKYWDGTSKLSFVYQNQEGNTDIYILDPMLGEETILTIPGNTEVEVARGYGVFRLKNVWKLGIDEKLGGALTAQTVTNNFQFPTFLWSDRSLDNVWNFVFNSQVTNIPFGDRIRMALFSLKVKRIDETAIDLAKNQFLKKQNLADGEIGYVINGPISPRLTVYFSDNSLSDKNLSFAIKDLTQTPGVSNKLGEILEVLGGKVVSIEKRGEGLEIDCLLKGTSKEAVKKVARLYGCTEDGGDSQFDLEMTIGKKFVDRF